MTWRRTNGLFAGLVIGGALGWLVARTTETRYPWPLWTAGFLAATFALRVGWLAKTQCRRMESAPTTRAGEACHISCRESDRDSRTPRDLRAR